jgi:ATP-binding cassette subfamily C protein CydC
MMYSANRWVFDMLRPFWRGVMLSVALGVLTIASSVALMMTSAWLISACALHPSIADLSVSIVSVRFFGIARAGFRYLERIVSHDTTFHLLAQIRVEFYRAIEPLAPARLSKYRTGDLLGRIVTDVQSLEDIYLRAVAPTIVALITGIGVVLIFGLFNWRVALAVAFFIVMTGIVIPLAVVTASRKYGKALVAARSELNAAIVDNLQGIAEITAYGLQAQQVRTISDLSVTLAKQQRRLSQIESLSGGAMILLMNSAALVALMVALPHVEGIYLASLTLSVFAGFEALMPISQMAHQWNVSLSAATRLQDIVSQKPAVHDPDHPMEIPSLTVKQGKRIAILGASGSGKSTLVNLFARFWDVPDQSIQIGGVALNALSQAEAHNAIAILSQQAYLFNTTILENIRLARSDATDAEVIDSAQRAQLDDLIQMLPNGYDTMVGENGAAVSGGERRRIALARILLKNAPIVVLDEPTAHLDTITERAVLETMLETLNGCSIILLTHRHVLLGKMDEIYYLSAGSLDQPDIN